MISRACGNPEESHSTNLVGLEKTDRQRQSQYSKQFSKRKGINIANIVTHLLYLFKKSVQCLSVHQDFKSLKYHFFLIIFKSHFALQIYAMDTFTYISPVLEAFHQVEDILAVQLVASLVGQEEASLVGLEAPSPAGLVVPFLVVGTQLLQVEDILAEEGELHLIIDKLINIWENTVFCLCVCFDAVHPSQ